MGNEPGECDTETEISSLAQNTAFVTVTISIGLAAVCLGLLTAGSTDQDKSLVVFSDKNPIILLLIVSEFFIATAVLTIDWFVDQFKDSYWKQLLHLKSTNKVNKYDQLLSRASLFNGGYLSLCLGIAVFNYAILTLAIKKLGVSNGYWLSIESVLSILFSGYLVVQMMTLNFGKRIYVYGGVIFVLGVIVGKS